MSDHLEPPRTLMDWCAGHIPDQYHTQCPGEFTSSLGVKWVCTCTRPHNQEGAGA